MRLHRRTEYALHISGHPVVYSTRAGFPLDRVSSLYPVDSPIIAPAPIELVALEPPDRLVAELPLVGGLAEESGVPIRLMSRETRADRPRSFGDPLEAFARLGVRGAHSWGLVVGFILDPLGDATASTAITKGQEPPFDLVIDRAYDADGPALPSGRGYLIDVNGECMVINAILGDGLILRVTHREVGGTARLTHTTQTGARDNPVVTGWQVVEWRSRLATLYAADVDATGAMGDAYEVLRGFLDNTPESSDGGLSFDTRLQPLTRIFDGDADLGVLTTTVVEGLHVHAPGGDHAIDFLETISTGDRSPFETVTRDATAAGSGVLDLDPVDVDRWVALYDPDADQPTLNPRAGALIVDDRDPVVVKGTDTEGVGDPDQLTVETPAGAAGPGQGARAGARLAPLLAPSVLHWRRVELLEVDDEERMLRWPGDPDDADDSGVGRINAQLAADDHLGADGAWLDVRIVGEVATLTRTTPARTTVVAAENDGVRVADIPGLDRAYGINGELVAAMERSAALSWLSAGQGDAALFAVNRSPTERQIRIARAFIRTGDTAILVTDPLDVSSGSIRVRYTNRDGRPRSRLVAVAPGLTEIVPAIGSPLDGSTIYRIDVLEPDRLPTVSDWDGSGITIEATPPAFPTSGGFLRWVMTGDGRPGIPAGSIDADSLASETSEPPYVGRWRVPETEPGEPLALAEVLEGALKLTRSTLLMQTGLDGVSRITRVRVAGENAARVRGELVATDCAESGPGTFTTDEEIRNAVSLRLDYGPIVDENGDVEFDYRLALDIDSRTSQTRFKEVRSEEVDAGAAGQIDRSQVGQIEASARSIVALLDAPRRRWVLTTSTARGLALPLGGTIRVTNPRLRGFTPDPVVDQLAVLTRRSVGLATEGAELEFRQTGRRPTGWNAAMQVTSVVNATTVIVAANAYAQTVGPDGTAWQDLAPFIVGASVRCCPRTDTDGGEVRSVTGVNPDTRAITLNAAHGLAIGDFLVPEGHSTAWENVDPFAWLADVDGELSGGVDGDEYE